MINEPDDPSLAAHSAITKTSKRDLRRTSFVAIVLLVLQAGIGMAVNLYVVVPAHHKGAHPSNFFGGSFQSVGWAVSHGAIILAIHAALGLSLAVFVVEVGYRATEASATIRYDVGNSRRTFRDRRRFQRASFLDFNKAVSSLLMALLTFGAIVCYGAILLLASSTVDD